MKYRRLFDISAFVALLLFLILIGLVTAARPTPPAGSEASPAQSGQR
jgi:hypothetical protein